MTKRKYGKYKLMIGLTNGALTHVTEAPVSTQREDVEKWLRDDNNVEELLTTFDTQTMQVHSILDDVTMELGRKQTVTREEVEDEG